MKVKINYGIKLFVKFRGRKCPNCGDECMGGICPNCGWSSQE